MIGQSTLFMGQNVIHLPRVDSTNAHCAALATAGAAPEGTVVWADAQTSGRGQRGRVWQSSVGQNVLASYLVLPTFLKAHQQFDLSRAVALGVFWAVRSMVVGEVRIKWPNDILVNGRKVAGILIECGLRGSAMGYAVCGIGLNVNQTEFEGLPNATSLALEMGRKFDRAEVLQALSAQLEGTYLLLRAGKAKQVRALFDTNLFRVDDWVELRLNGQPSQLFILGTQPDGRLLAKTRSGQQLALMHHELEWML